MDLVDIDKVLDNLELREAADENNRTQAVNHQAKGTANHANTNGSYIVYGPTVTASPPSTSNKHFIGVSQVFHSLDDYRKNVATLESIHNQKYDEECRPINNMPYDDGKDVAAGLNNENDLSEEPTVSGLNDIVKSKYIHERRHSTESDEDDVDKSKVDDEDGDGDDDEDEDDDDDDDDCRLHTDDYDDEEASNDIPKFTERLPKHLAANRLDMDGDDYTITTSSDSLTTSSPSTFSSGPSPALGSTTDERLTPPSPVEVTEGDDDVDVDNDQNALLENNNEQVELEQYNEANDDEVDDVESIQTNHDMVEEAGVSGLDDIALGLSSISLNTMNIQKNLQSDLTVSSALGNVLENLSETTTTSPLSQLRDGDSSDHLKVEENHIETALNNEVIECNNKAAVEAAADVIYKQSNEMATKIPIEEPAKYIQPVTFSYSTMDEISDTELDSMLQEMDIDDVNEEKPTNLTNETIAEGTEINSADVGMIDDTASNAADCSNADSFSQASTVEFSEMRAQSVNQMSAIAVPIATPAVAATEESFNSYSSTESSLDGEPLGSEDGDENGRPTRPQRPTTLNLNGTKMSALLANAGQTPPGITIPQQAQATENNADSLQNDTNEVDEATGYSDPHIDLGKIPPIWVPDNMATACMQCHTKFTMIKRRHHCRACGKVLCSVCCSQKFKLEFLSQPAESRVCVQCYLILSQRQQQSEQVANVAQDTGDTMADGDGSSDVDENIIIPTSARSPNPNNPMEYCSTIPPYRQVSATAATQPPPSVIVPVGVLKKESGSFSSNSSNSSNKAGRKRKSVMFSDGIAPGSDLASLENQWGEAKCPRRTDKSRGGNTNTSAAGPSTPIRNEATVLGKNVKEQSPAAKISTSNAIVGKKTGSDERACFIPNEPNALPPICMTKDDKLEYKEIANDFDLIERLQEETLKFAINKNFFVHIKIVHLKCCMNRTVINFTTQGMHQVGNDEIIILLEYLIPPDKRDLEEPPIPKDIFIHLNEIYQEAEHGNPIGELTYTSPQQSTFLGSREYGGFIYIRATFQCLQDLIVPENPYLIGVLIHRHEVPWAKVFPLRLMLRLGAQYRYYPCPHISVRNRDSVYAEIAQTIISFLADFRNYTYTLSNIRGMYIHMEDRQTTVLIPRNRLEDVIKAMDNSSDHILAFSGNFSKTADGHLVCMQNVNDNRNELYSYSTQAINIQGHPRKVTGASFFVLNEALKSTSGLSGKCVIVEDGLMVQILSTKMEEVRNALRNQADINIVCGPLDADEEQTEVVSIKWVENDRDYNMGIKSAIDGKSLEGISSMRVHASFNYSNLNYSIRLTDIFVLKYDDWYNNVKGTPAAGSLDVTRLAEQIARSASMALVPFLDLLVKSGNTKIGLRATLHQDNVGYEAGTQGNKLPPLYMNALDNHLIPTLHNESANIDEEIILELIFYILNA